MVTKNDLYYVDPSHMKGRRWVNDYVKTLDPEKDFERIASIIAMYQQDEASMSLFIASTAVQVLMPAHGAEPVLFTNNFIRRPNLRNQNTLSFFWTWFGKGPGSPEGIEATKRLNHIHQRIEKHLPGHFNYDSDYIYTLSLFTTVQNRMLKRLGLPEQDPVVKKAMYNFFATVAKHIRKGDDSPVEGYPKSFEELEAYVEDWERWDHRMTIPQQQLILAFMEQWVVKAFPKPLRKMGRWIIYYTIPDHIMKHYKIKPLSGFPRFFARNFLKLAFIYKSKIAADNKVPFLERRKKIAKDELKKQDAEFREIADKEGWTVGGYDAVYVNEGASNISACPIMSNSQFSKDRLKDRAPDEVLKRLEKVTENDRIEYDEFADNEEFKPTKESA